jgi:hypothetical protein
MEPNQQIQSISQKKLPTWLTTVTPFSKALAMFLFILFPFVGFYLGMKYQQIVPLNTTTISITPTLTPETKNTGKYILYQDTQAPTGDIVYQTEIPVDWTAYTNYDSKASDGTSYDIGMGIYTTNLGPSHFSLPPKNTSETLGMTTDILIYYSKSPSAISKIVEMNQVLNTKTLNVDGVTAKQFSHPDQGGMTTNVLITKNNTTFLIAEPNGSGDGSEILKHILLTLKVVKGQLY